MGVFNAIGSFFTGAWNTVTGAVHSVYEGVKAIYTYVISIINNVGEAWKTFSSDVSNLAGALSQFAGTIANTIGHIVTSTIPKALGGALTGAERLIGGAAGKLLKLAESGAKALIADAVKIINTAISDVKAELSGIAGQVSKAVSWVENVGATVAGWIADPSKLVTFIEGDLVLPVLKWLLGAGEAAAEQVGKWLLANATSILHELEQILADII
jgi:phage-related protein